MNTMTDQDFKRFFTILMNVWDNAGETAKANGLQGDAVTQAQEATMNQFMNHIDELRKGNQ
jgi:hypothetical protein